MTSEQWYSLAEVADALNLTREAVRLRIKRGEMAAIKVGAAGWAVAASEVARHRTLTYKAGRRPKHAEPQNAHSAASAGDQRPEVSPVG